MNEVQYADHVKRMSSIHGIAATKGMRNDLEMRYFLHHRTRGARLRGKYRPS